MITNLKRISGWSIPSRASYWSFWLAVIATPSVIIGYFQLFGNDQIREPLLRALQASLRPEIRLVNLAAEEFLDDGLCLTATFENISMYPARNARWHFLDEPDIPSSPFASPVLNLRNIQISAKSTQKLVICRMPDLETSLRKREAGSYHSIVGFRKIGESSHLAGRHLPYVLRVQFDTDAGETVTKDLPIYVIIQ